jgi:hypothetical protein
MLLLVRSLGEILYVYKRRSPYLEWHHCELNDNLGDHLRITSNVEVLMRKSETKT